MADMNTATAKYGVNNLLIDNCIIDGGSTNQLGWRINWFGGNLTVINSEWTNVGWGILVRYCSLSIKVY
jgi:hypothetical protein